MDEFNSENKVGEDVEYNDVSADEHEKESEHFCEGKTLLTHALIKLLKMLKTKKGLSLNHTRKEVCLAYNFKLWAN